MYVCVWLSACVYMCVCVCLNSFHPLAHIRRQSPRDPILYALYIYELIARAFSDSKWDDTG